MYKNKITGANIRDQKILKYYRLTRRFITRTYNIKEADLEVLVYLDCLEFFSKKDFKDGLLEFSWDKRRWDRLLKEGWIVVWRQRNRTDILFSLYKTSVKSKLMLLRMYKILAGEEDFPETKRRSVFAKGKRYTDKVLKIAVKKANKDKSRTTL